MGEIISHAKHLKQQKHRYGDKEQSLARLMRKNHHAAQGSEGTQGHGSQQEHNLGDTPLMIVSLMLVVTIQSKGHDVGKENP